MTALGIARTPFDRGRSAYGEPITLTILLITGIATALAAGGKGVDAASKAAAAKAAAFQAAGENNPCVQRINAQIAQIPRAIIPITATQKANKAKRDQLESQRDAYLAHPESCGDIVAAQAQAQQQVQIQQQTATTASNVPYFALGGLLLATAGIVTAIAVARRK